MTITASSPPRRALRSRRLRPHPPPGGAQRHPPFALASRRPRSACRCPRCARARRKRNLCRSDAPSWAGLPVTITLVARDDAGQEARAPPSRSPCPRAISASRLPWPLSSSAARSLSIPPLSARLPISRRFHSRLRALHRGQAHLSRPARRLLAACLRAARQRLTGSSTSSGPPRRHRGWRAFDCRSRCPPRPRRARRGARQGR